MQANTRVCEENKFRKKMLPTETILWLKVEF